MRGGNEVTSARLHVQRTIFAVCLFGGEDAAVPAGEDASAPFTLSREAPFRFDRSDETPQFVLAPKLLERSRVAIEWSAGVRAGWFGAVFAAEPRRLCRR